MRRWFVAVTLALLLAAACDAGTPATSVAPSSTTSKASVTTVVDDAVTTTTLGPGQTVPTTLPFVDTALELQVVADGFEQPVFFTEHDGTYYVVDQPGVIWGMAPGGDPSVYLDLGDRVRFGGEQGLLGLAFHPEHADILYVNYTGHDGRTVVSEFTGADAESERIVLEIAQPAGNHNGGMIAFGPLGDLWVGTGDGGAADDKFGNGQNEHTLLGAMLRLTVGPSIETTGSGQNRIFAAPEVAAIGLRNPWRFSFDYENVWIADVGQGDVEEINRVSVEGFDDNFGWPLYEGTDCFAGPCTGVDVEGRVLSEPVHEYRHDEGCSITGGYVYRGSAMPQLDGHYFFSDWCTGFIRSLAPDGSVHDWTEGTGTVPAVTSFGRDESGEVYVVSGEGTIYRLVESSD